MNENIYCFFGVDGAGKTTTIKGVKKRLEKKGKKVIIIRMNRAGDHKLPLIKEFMELKNWYLKKKKVKPRKGFKDVLVDIYRERGFLFMVVYYLDLWLRFLEAKKLSKNNTILMDRFFYDGLALTKKGNVSFFRKITPKVKSFFLYAPPKIILKRKKEATSKNMVDYTKRVEENMMPYFEILKIDTSKPLKKVIEKIEADINNG